MHLNHGGQMILRFANKSAHFRKTYTPRSQTPVWEPEETSLCFEPAGLEKAFLFQMTNRTILKDTIRDITSVSHFFTNIAKEYAEVFGNVKVPDDEEWWVMAFPKFDTNLYDYAGRNSNHLLYEFIENLFDACAHMDGTT